MTLILVGFNVFKQQKNKTDKRVEEENAKEEAHHPHIKDSFAFIPQPPLRRPRISCALVDLDGATFTSTGDDTVSKSEHDVAADQEV